MTTDSPIALVTGANRGIGHAVAAQLADRGMTVLVAARSETRGKQAAAELAATDAEVHSLVLDVTTQHTIDAAARHIEQHYGRLDVLVNNAGISGAPRSPSTATLDEVREVFETNVFGLLAVTNTMLPLLRRSAAARIVNLSSGSASLTDQTDPDHDMSRRRPTAAYPMSKSAVNAVTVQYAKELAAEGILVNAAAPGACDTDFARNLGMSLTRTAAQGAAIIVHLATLGADGPTGGFFDDDGAHPW